MTCPLRRNLIRLAKTAGVGSSDFYEVIKQVKEHYAGPKTLLNKLAGRIVKYRKNHKFDDTA